MSNQDKKILFAYYFMLFMGYYIIKSIRVQRYVDRSK